MNIYENEIKRAITQVENNQNKLQNITTLLIHYGYNTNIKAARPLSNKTIANMRNTLLNNKNILLRALKKWFSDKYIQRVLNELNSEIPMVVLCPGNPLETLNPITELVYMYENLQSVKHSINMLEVDNKNIDTFLNETQKTLEILLTTMAKDKNTKDLVIIACESLINARTFMKEGDLVSKFILEVYEIAQNDDKVE